MEEIIEQYLLGQLSKEEKAAFEHRINTEPNLAKEVKIQRELMEAIKIQGLKADIVIASESYLVTQRIKKFLLIAVVTILIICSILYLKNKSNRINQVRVIQTGKELVFDSVEVQSKSPQGINLNQETDNTSTEIVQKSVSNLKLRESNDNTPKEDSSIWHPRLTDQRRLKSQIIIPYTVDSPVINNSKTYTPTTFAKQTQLQNYLKSEYPSFYEELANDFDLDDPTFHASFKVNYCNFKKTPIITASDDEKAEQYEIDMSNTIIKSREFKKFFELCALN